MREVSVNPLRCRGWRPCTLALALALVTAVPVMAEENGAAPAGEGSLRLDGIYVVGDKAEDFRTVPGSAHRVDQETLERDEYDNIHRILNEVPGVYIRGEEGYGNRPNIGLRGTTTERSQKITLMVDRILAAPAPYTAPAAYYFPQVSRMTGVEVVKGPAAIANGPATVGGSINLVTRPIPMDRSGGVDLGAGSDGYHKLHGYYGDSSERAGFLVEGIRTQTDGFKDLDSGGDTGFEKDDLMFKGRLNNDPNADIYHQLDVTFTYADESSNETYLGLTDADFDRDPFRRYAASQRAQFDWDYWRAELRHRVEFGLDTALTTTAYNQHFDRSWAKINRFNTDRTINEILASPEAGLNRAFVDVLRGDKDSETLQETLLLGTNDRQMFSRGLQSQLDMTRYLAATRHELQLGLRLHQDGIDRDHTEDGFLMQDGVLVSDGNDTVQTLLEDESANTVSGFLMDKMTYGNLQVTTGIRVEYISYDSENRQTGRQFSNDELIALPSLGVHYQLTPRLGVLAGVHRGFVPSGPSEAEDVEGEKSVNYEAGFRYTDTHSAAEVIGFFTDYSDLQGICTFSSGCIEATGEAFNGGEVNVYGVELVGRHQWMLPNGWRVPASVTYTFTESEFQSDFDSAFPLWGQVREGDELPYMPRHRVGASLGLASQWWDSTFKLAYVGEQREKAGSDGPLGDKVVDSYTVVDWVGSYRLNHHNEFYLRVDNLLDNEYLISRRPLGAKPGKDRSIEGGYKFTF